MWNKIYPMALAVAVIIMIVLIYLTYSQLQSIGFAPPVIAADFLTYEGYYQQFLGISTIILLILANILLWTKRRSWALWVTLGYFVLFVLLEGWWLDRLYFDYQQKNLLASGGLYTNGFISAVLCVAAAVVVFFDQFLILRLQERMYPSSESVESDTGEVSQEENPPEAEI